ncbi:MAG: NAD(P)-dependent oxidoreductase [Burkholderiales bacterium]|nr:NAD(P)-dependent oxidoreductase [Burkholderiales bacterium]
MTGAVGMIGLGIMGSAMAGNLLAAGFRVVGCDVVPAARKALARQGGVAVASAGAVARRADVAITSLPSVAALDAVAADLAGAARRGLVVVETSTLPIEAKERARRALARAGATLLDCPLSGTGAQARTRDLAVYASGPRPAYRRVIPVLEGFARAHYHVGPFGAGSRMKFVANLLVAIHNVAAAEAMTLALKAGLDPAQVLKVIGDGAGSSRMFQVRGPMMVANDYSEATMKVAVWQKDMRIIGEFAAALDCPTPLFAASAPIYNAAMASGHALDDTASVCAVLEAMAGIERRTPRPAARRRARGSGPVPKKG